jgi:membrane protease YdiL (CAAX protease family)
MDSIRSVKGFGAGSALLVFAVFWIAAGLGGAAVIVPLMAPLVFTESGLDVENLESFFRTIKPLALTVGVVFGAGMALLAARFLLKRAGAECWTETLALKWGTPLHLLLALATGAALGIAQRAVLVQREYPSPESASGADELGAFLLYSGIQTLLLAPTIEEFLFRGVLFSGFSSSWGVGLASVLVTVGFVAYHLQWDLNLVPWTAAVAIGALVFRMVGRALGPAVALHFGFNLVIFGAVLWKVRAFLP